jgi:hypothetical protein
MRNKLKNISKKNHKMRYNLVKKNPKICQSFKKFVSLAQTVAKR